MPRLTFSTVWALWSRPRLVVVVRTLACAAAAALFLNAAGTLDAGFTVTPSYALLALAVVLGLPSVVRGWLSLPRRGLLTAGVLAAIYAAGVIFGSDLGLSSQASRSSNRDLVYFADLLLGLAIVGLLVGAFADRRSRQRLIVWLCLGGLTASMYAIYQWLALHYGWPLSDINNAVNSDGYTVGHQFQGVGIFGWERVRGTFKEPLFLASYLVVVVVLAFGRAVGGRGRDRIRWLAVAAAALVALAATASSLAWGTLALIFVIVATLWAVASGRSRAAAVLGAVLAAAVLTAPPLFADPSLLSSLTGRSKADLRTTSQNRLNAWKRVNGVWSARPIFGHGPGQSAVRLAYRPSVPPGERAPIVLGSAQGLWAASLIDVGLLGFFAWIALFACLFGFALPRAVRALDPIVLAATAAALSAVLLGELAGDRLDTRVWITLGLMCAATRNGRQQEAAGSRAGPHEAAE